MSKKNQPVECLELCSQCAIDDAFKAIEQAPLDKQIDLLMSMWVNRYREELRTVAALFAATTDVSQRWADEQQPVKKRTAKLQVAA